MFGIYKVVMNVGGKEITTRAVLRDSTAEADAKNYFESELVKVVAVKIENYHILVSDISNDEDLADTFNRMYMIKA